MAIAICGHAADRSVATQAADPPAIGGSVGPTNLSLRARSRRRPHRTGRYAVVSSGRRLSPRTAVSGSVSKGYSKYGRPRELVRSSLAAVRALGGCAPAARERASTGRSRPLRTLFAQYADRTTRSARRAPRRPPPIRSCLRASTPDRAVMHRFAYGMAGVLGPNRGSIWEVTAANQPAIRCNEEGNRQRSGALWLKRLLINPRVSSPW